MTVTSAAKRRDNRRNAMRSNGLKSGRATRRASINASRYSLSAPATPLEQQLELEAIVNALEEKLLDTQVRVRIAEAIFEFERNITYQHDIF